MIHVEKELRVSRTTKKTALDRTAQDVEKGIFEGSRTRGNDLSKELNARETFSESSTEKRRQAIQVIARSVARGKCSGRTYRKSRGAEPEGRLLRESIFYP